MTLDIIRKFYDADSDSVMKIWYDGNLEVHDFVDVSYWDRNYGYVSRLIKRVEVYVYESEGQVVGFIGFDEGYISGLFVRQDYRGFGIGSRLFNYIRENNDFFTLHVFEKNEAAVRFYEKMGMHRHQAEVNEDLGEVEYHMYYRKPKPEF